MLQLPTDQLIIITRMWLVSGTPWTVSHALPSCGWLGVAALPASTLKVDKEARGVLSEFLLAVIRHAQQYTEHARGTVITGMDVAHALQGLGRALSYAPATSTPVGLFAQKSIAGVDGFGEDPGFVEDDLTQPDPQGAMPYLFAFRQLIRENLQEFFLVHTQTRSADVLLRRATEDFVADVFAVAHKSSYRDVAGTPALHVDAFRWAAR